jgi:hypothetical protein
MFWRNVTLTHPFNVFSQFDNKDLALWRHAYFDVSSQNSQMPTVGEAHFFSPAFFASDVARGCIVARGDRGNHPKVPEIGSIVTQFTCFFTATSAFPTGSNVIPSVAAPSSHVLSSPAGEP